MMLLQVVKFKSRSSWETVQDSLKVVEGFLLAIIVVRGLPYHIKILFTHTTDKKNIYSFVGKTKTWI